MGTPDTTYVARVLLFDRLTDFDPQSASEPQPLRALTHAELLISIRRELSALLNTRCAIPFHELFERERSVVDYGLPDFTGRHPTSQEDVQLLQSIIERTVAAFEPRLRHPRVTIGGYEQETGSLRCHIAAELYTETLSEAVSFPVFIHSTGMRQHGQSTP